ncbi:hypothetical protein VSVS12_04271 [Vibrio scophthalmi]|uniref:Uncharacterized protein n=3 Tax=Vibrionaceae TaxID=641 RepID=A0A1B1NW88_9VIBR|nr:hypothetical protein VSVS12_04271 [Vibrio scophthalmi]ANU38786.1 hypothetical protein VSVS05_03750 [Vibrio scophthalmi]EGU31660.1 hypothetical protein VIS19158_18926 [Vibrio scophthalmi LMG 19158]ODS04198.1 hypothetical protein VSF3289_03329 [Vibrio scophthalmi]
MRLQCPPFALSTPLGDIMEHKEFEELVKAASQQEALPQALAILKASEDQEVAEAAASLAGQFSLAEVDGEKRIYHVTTHEDEQGEEQEFVEHVMNEGDEVIRFVAWFFDAMFEVKRKDTYQAAGKTYLQPKRS